MVCFEGIAQQQKAPSGEPEGAKDSKSN